MGELFRQCENGLKMHRIAGTQLCATVWLNEIDYALATVIFSWAK